MEDIVALVILFGAIFVVFLVFSIPIIWALNTLFGLGIAYTFKTALATALLAGVFSAKGGSTK